MHFLPLNELCSWAGIRKMFDGLKARAEELGYRLEPVFLDGSAAAEQRYLKRVRDLRISGATVLGSSWPEAETVLLRLAEMIPVVSAGSALAHLGLNFTESDHFRGTKLALKKMLESGAQRPGLVVEKRFDDQVGGVISGAFWSIVTRFPKQNRIEPLMDWGKGPEDFKQRLVEWWAKTNPDCILTNRKGFSPIDWAGFNPTDHPAPVFQLSVNEDSPGWSGVHYPSEHLGHAAVDMVVAQIHRGERGLPSFQKCSLCEGRWVDRPWESNKPPLR